jgi:hypothetical protein
MCFVFINGGIAIATGDGFEPSTVTPTSQRFLSGNYMSSERCYCDESEKYRVQRNRCNDECE